MPRSHRAGEQIFRWVAATHRAQAGVDARREGLKQGGGAWREAGEIGAALRLEAAGAAGPVDLGHPPAADQRPSSWGAQVADQRGETAGAEVADQIEEEEAVGGLRETERRIEIALLLGIAVQHPVAVPDHFEAAMSPREMGSGESG